MSHLTTVEFDAPYLIMIGDIAEVAYAKTGFGILQWRPDSVAGQLRLPGCKVDMGIADLNIEQAVSVGVKSLIIGVAPIAGVIPDNWWRVIEEAVTAGIDIVCGLHLKLGDIPAIASAAKKSGARLIDVRNPPKQLPVGNGQKRSGKRVLMVGTDCAVGKKYTALALEQAMKNSGMNATFRATGQTGIMLAGSGIPIDAVVSDFISGAAELVSPGNDANHWDVIEGQGSLFNPSYAGVSLGLLHGSQPDALVVCHEANRQFIIGIENYLSPTITECIERNLLMASLTNPLVQCIGVSVNTSALSSDEREKFLSKISNETGLPCIDPLIDGCGLLVNEIQRRFH
ncbi:MAG: DUF1611 domain-containing protein [Kangiellaceae bacterium]|nr:DUF1611 domain-containing protein [Kangiellaceae bacterium]